MGAAFLPDFIDQTLNVAAAAVFEHLDQLGHRGTLGAGSFEMLEQEFLFRLAVQPLLAGMDARLSEETVKLAGQD